MKDKKIRKFNVEADYRFFRELRENLGDDFKLVLYGHSMGAAIGTHATVLAEGKRGINM